VYLNSLALQAIVDRCANSSPAQRHISAVGFHSRKGSGGGKSIPSHLFEKCIGEDRKYLDEITDGCKSVFKIVLDLGPNLKYLSVRTFFRVIAVTVILLKTFALGAKENNIMQSIEQIKRLIEAVNQFIVDDIHIGNRFAHTCDVLIERIQPRLVRFNYPTTPSNGLRKIDPSIPNSPAFTPNQLQGMSTTDPSALFQSSLNPYPLDSPYGDPKYNLMLQPGMGDINMQNGNDNLFNHDMMSQSSGEWLSLPMDNFFGLENGAEISTNAFGTELNGYDMLDVLLKGGNSPT
jgi:hypothetical protein